MNDVLENYETLKASDLERDGMALELNDRSTGETVAEVFYHDPTGSMTFSAFRAELPLTVVEMLIERARRDLPSRRAD